MTTNTRKSSIDLKDVSKSPGNCIVSDMLLRVNVGEWVRISAGRETLWSLAIGRYGIKHGSRDQFRFTRRLYTGKVTVTQRFDYLKGTFNLLHLRRNFENSPKSAPSFDVFERYVFNLVQRNLISRYF